MSADSPAPGRLPHVRRWPGLGPAAALIGLLLSLTYVALAQSSGPSLLRCPWKELAGFPCAFCNTTSAVALLVTGHPLAALVRNPLVTLLYCVWFCYAATVMIRVVFGRLVRIPLSRRVEVGLTLSFVVALAANWIYLALWHP